MERGRRKFRWGVGKSLLGGRHAELWARGLEWGLSFCEENTAGGGKGVSQGRGSWTMDSVIQSGWLGRWGERGVISGTTVNLRLRSLSFLSTTEKSFKILDRVTWTKQGSAKMSGRGWRQEPLEIRRHLRCHFNCPEMKSLDKANLKKNQGERHLKEE